MEASGVRVPQPCEDGPSRERFLPRTRHQHWTGAGPRWGSARLVGASAVQPENLVGAALKRCRPFHLAGALPFVEGAQEDDMESRNPARSRWLRLAIDADDMRARLDGESDEPVREGDSEKAWEALQDKADDFAFAFGPF